MMMVMVVVMLITMEYMRIMTMMGVVSHTHFSSTKTILVITTYTYTDRPTKAHK